MLGQSQGSRTGLVLVSESTEITESYTPDIFHQLGVSRSVVLHHSSETKILKERLITEFRIVNCGSEVEIRGRRDN